MDSDLLNHIRLLLQDTEATPVVSDVHIGNLAKSRRKEIYFEGLASDDGLIWHYGRPYIETTLLSLTYEGGAVDEDDYAADSIAGTWTFATEQSAVYLRGYVYDLLDIVAQAWLVKAGLIDSYPGLSYTLGDETVSKADAKEYCVEQYWRFRTSKGGQLRRR